MDNHLIYVYEPTETEAVMLGLTKPDVRAPERHRWSSALIEALRRSEIHAVWRATLGRRKRRARRLGFVAR